MNYELAKALKDSGYYKGREFQCMKEDLKKYPNKPYAFEGQDAVYCPTLEELLEACGNEFETLYKHQFGWLAKGTKRTSVVSFFPCDGNAENPTDAVVKLWLALNPV